MSKHTITLPIRLLVLYLSLVSVLVLHLSCYQAPETGASISSADLAVRIRGGAAPFILDVRTAKEYQAGHIPGSVNISHDQLSERLSELGISKTEEMVVYCESGRRAALAEKVLAESGYARVRDLEGHMKGWRKFELPTE